MKSMGSGYRTQCLASLAELEEAREGGFLAAWEELIAQDPTANFFQGPVWSMAWYRSFSDRFRPLVIVVKKGNTLVGLVPLAVDKITGELVFAGSGMSDYRDVVARPEHRKGVIVDLLALYRAGNYPNPLRLGYTQPDSESLSIVVALSGFSSGVYTIVRSHPCYRYWFGNGAAAKKLTSKESVRRRISHYRRQGELSLNRIKTDDAWRAIREEFYDQHSLRQMYVGRPVSFNDPRKRALYDTLFRESPSSVHVTAMRVGERMVAAHYGVLWRDVLYWGAPSFDIREEKYSPGQVMLALLIQSAEASGLRGVDLTIGTEDFKRRFGNSRVELPTAEIYARPRKYYARRVRDETVTAAKFIVTKLKGAQEWDRVKETLTKGLDQAPSADEPNVRAVVGELGRRAALTTGEKSRWLSFVKTRPAAEGWEPVLPPIAALAFNQDRLQDLLQWDGQVRDVKQQLTETVKKAPELLRHGHILHTALVNDRLAGWCWSNYSQERVELDETHPVRECEPNSVLLEDFHLIPHLAESQVGALFLTHILRGRFADGAKQAYIKCNAADVARRAIEEAGFHLLAVDELVRFLHWKRSRRRIQARMIHELQGIHD